MYAGVDFSETLRGPRIQTILHEPDLDANDSLDRSGAVGFFVDACIALLVLLPLLIVGIGAVNAAMRASVAQDDPDDTDPI